MASRSTQRKRRQAAAAQDPAPAPAEVILKVLVLGDPATGKTSICKRALTNTFFDTYKSTIGVSFENKRLTVDGTNVKMQLWDIAGQDRYQNIVRVYYAKSQGVFVVYDLNDRKSFDSVLRWKKEIDDKVRLPNGDPVPCVLIGNKCDVCTKTLSKVQGEIDQFCNEHGFVKGFLTSAKENINIEEAAEFLCRHVLQTQGAEGFKKARPQEAKPFVPGAAANNGALPDSCC